jgi:hypothetical protein
MSLKILFIYKLNMGCSNSSSEKTAVINPVPLRPPATPEFDNYASNKYGFTLEIQEKIKEALGDLDIKMKLSYRYEGYSKQVIDWEKRRMMIKSFTGKILILATGLGGDTFAFVVDNN